MTFWKRLFSSPDTIGKAVDAVIDTGDALFYTDEEKAENNMKVFELKLKAAEATQGSRLARRLLAVMFTGVFLFGVLLCFLFVILAAYTCGDVGADGYCAPIVAQEGLERILTSAAMGGSVVAIISWYFWSGVKRIDK